MARDLELRPQRIKEYALSLGVIEIACWKNQYSSSCTITLPGRGLRSRCLKTFATNKPSLKVSPIDNSSRNRTLHLAQ